MVKFKEKNGRNQISRFRDVERSGAKPLTFVQIQVGKIGGLQLSSFMDFPEKVWNECVRCPFFSNCREIAVVLELDS